LCQKKIQKNFEESTTMKNFFESKFAFAAISCLFTAALAWNMAHGNEAMVGQHASPAPAMQRTAHLPPPPDPPSGGGGRVGIEDRS
jgi:hypothetical protein